jgi:hypothetical protein
VSWQLATHAAPGASADGIGAGAGSAGPPLAELTGATIAGGGARTLVGSGTTR